MPLIDPDWFGFTAEHGRWPAVGDKRKPWSYRGWLISYVQLAHVREAKGTVNRWGYLFACHEKNGLVDAPIPQVIFKQHPDGTKALKTWVGLLTGGRNAWAALDLLVAFLSWGLGVSTDEPKLTDAEAEALYRGINLESWLVHPYDYLGDYIAENLGGGPHAFFPTPMDLVSVIAQLTIGDPKEDVRHTTVCDPCLGTGRFLLHASNYSMRLSGQDIDPFVIKVSLINGALWAPWMVAPPPDHWFNSTRRVLPPPPARGRVLPPPPGPRRSVGPPKF